jgi:monofunctional chorismate mutase
VGILDVDIEKLRKEIDLIDERILELLRKRMRISAEIGRMKREKGIPIYDERREAEVLERAGIFSNVFKEIVTMSKSVQERKKLGIIGFGRMGRFMAEELSPFVDIAYWDPNVSSNEFQKVELEELAEKSDMIMVSTPTLAAADVIKRAGSMMQENSIIFDISTVKSGLKEALESVRGRSCSIHPMFGPCGNREKKVLLIKVKGDCSDLLRILLLAGFRVKTSSFELHDRMIAKTIGIPYLLAASLLLMTGKEEIAHGGTSLSYFLRYSSCISGENAELFEEIIGNKELDSAVNDLLSAMKKVIETVRSGKVGNILEELRKRAPEDPKKAYKLFCKFINSSC